MPVNPIPERHSPVTPSLTFDDCAAAIDWYVEVFGAAELGDRMVGPDGRVGHAELDVGGSVVMMSDEWPDGPTRSPTALGGSPGALFLYSADAEAIWERALARGAEVIFPLERQFYGHLAGRIRDPFGHQWGIGKQVEEVSAEQMAERVKGFYEE